MTHCAWALLAWRVGQPSSHCHRPCQPSLAPPHRGTASPKRYSWGPEVAQGWIQWQTGPRPPWITHVRQRGGEAEDTPLPGGSLVGVEAAGSCYRAPGQREARARAWAGFQASVPTLLPPPLLGQEQPLAGSPTPLSPLFLG